MGAIDQGISDPVWLALQIIQALLAYCNIGTDLSDGFIDRFRLSLISKDSQDSKVFFCLKHSMEAATGAWVSKCFPEIILLGCDPLTWISTPSLRFSTHPFNPYLRSLEYKRTKTNSLNQAFNPDPVGFGTLSLIVPFH